MTNPEQTPQPNLDADTPEPTDTDANNADDPIEAMVKDKRDHDAEPAAPVDGHDDDHDDDIDEPADVVMVSRAAINYAVIAIVFFVVGLLIGMFAVPSQQSGLPDNFEAVVRGAVADALADTDIQAAAAEPEDTNAVPGQRYTVDFTPGEDPALGNPEAPITILEFSDFTCGFCGRFARDTLPALLEEFPEDVNFVYMDYPFLSQLSYPMALAAECADDQGQFWEYHDVLFSGEVQVAGIDMLFTIAQNLELDMDEFTACFDEETHRDEIVADYELGAELGVSGTPGFFVNGRFVSGAQPITEFRRIIEEELNRLEEAGA